METTPEIQALIDAAIESAVTGLKNKNNELITEVRKLKQGREIDPKEVERMDAMIEDLQGKINEQNKATKAAMKAAEENEAKWKTEAAFTQKLLIDNGLTEALVKAGVAPQFLQATKSMFAGQAQIIAEGDTRTAKLGDKAIADAIKEWAASDDGKHFIAAPGNSGGGSHGGSGSGTGGATMTRAQFDAMSPATKMEFSKKGGNIVD